MCSATDTSLTRHCHAIAGRAFDVCVCSATDDGETFNEGMSCSFEIPPPVFAHVREGMDLSQASPVNHQQRRLDCLTQSPKYLENAHERMKYKR